MIVKVLVKNYVLEQNFIHSIYRVMSGEEEINHMKRTLPSHNLMYEVKGLQQLLEYQFWVTASTKIGEGQSSKVATQILSSARSKNL